MFLIEVLFDESYFRIPFVDLLQLHHAHLTRSPLLPFLGRAYEIRRRLWFFKGGAESLIVFIFEGCIAVFNEVGLFRSSDSLHFVGSIKFIYLWFNLRNLMTFILPL